MTMVEPEKPFACSIPECGMTFTNEDHLNVHTRKHDMVLQFGCEQKAAVFVGKLYLLPFTFFKKNAFATICLTCPILCDN